MPQITIRVHGIPVVLTLDEAVALRATLDEVLREAGRLLDEGEALPGEALGWMAGATWMREQAAGVARARMQFTEVSVVYPPTLYAEVSDAILALPLAPTAEAATIEPAPERRGGGDHGRG